MKSQLFLWIATLLLSQAASAGPELKFGPIHPDSQLAVVAGEVATEWADGNISSGTTRLRIGILPSAIALDSQLANRNFKSEYDYHTDGEELPVGTELYVSSGSLNFMWFTNIVESIALSNDYSPACVECREEIKESLGEVLNLLGDDSDLMVFEADTGFLNDVIGVVTGASSVLIVNKKTRSAIRLFLIEGRI